MTRTHSVRLTPVIVYSRLYPWSIARVIVARKMGARLEASRIGCGALARSRNVLPIPYLSFTWECTRPGSTAVSPLFFVFGLRNRDSDQGSTFGFEVYNRNVQVYQGVGPRRRHHVLVDEV